MTDLSAAPRYPRIVAALRLAATSIFAMYLCRLFELNTPEW